MLIFFRYDILEKEFNQEMIEYSEKTLGLWKPADSSHLKLKMQKRGGLS